LSEAPYLLDKGFPKHVMSDELTTYLRRHKPLFKVKWCKNLGPYRKLLPLLKKKMGEDCLIITIDDDTEYVPTLVADYLKDYDTHHCCISYRGFTPKIETSLNDISYYVRDQLKQTYLYNFHTGKGGVVYHPTFFEKTKNLIFDEKIYQECCETADDIWFNFMRICGGIPCHIKNKNYMKRDQTTSLSLYRNFNMKDDLNTVNIHKTVTKLMSLQYLKDIEHPKDANHSEDTNYPKDNIIQQSI
jgi:hypothetical protein